MSLALTIILLLLPLAAAWASPVPPEPTPPAPTIATDQHDYPPGADVTLTGAGWIADEAIEIVVDDALGATWQHRASVTADASGAFEHVFTISDVFISDYTVTATGAVSGTATSAFTDSPGAYTVKWYASDPAANRSPYLPTYARVLPAQLAPYPVGRANDPLRHAVAYGPTASSLDAVTSLSSQSMALGQVVPFQLEIAVSGSTTPENGTITVSPVWSARTSSGGDFGFDPTYGLIAAFVDYGDAGNRDPLGNAIVSSFSWTRAGAGTSNDRVVGEVTITGLNDGDRVIVELWAVLKSSIPSGVSGNIPTSLAEARTGPALGSGERISTGNQTVPLLRVGEFFSAQADVAIAETDGPDPVLAGDRLTYTLTVVNNSTTTVSNGVVVTDTLDPNTAFISGSWPGGVCTAVENVVTCALGALSPLQSTTIQVVTTVSPVAPTANDPSSTPATGTCTAAGPGIDLCNRVSVTAITSDPNLANNSASAPTNVTAGAVTLTKVSGCGDYLPGAQFRLYQGVPADPFNPSNPGTEYGPKLLYTTDATGHLTVTGLPYGNYYFVETQAPTGFLLDPAPIPFKITVSQDVRTEQVTKTNWGKPAIEKYISQAGTTADTASYNQNVTWRLQPKVPGNISAYQYYRIDDTIDPRLTYTGNLTVRVGSTLLTPGVHYTATEPTGAANGTLQIELIVANLQPFETDKLALINNTVITYTTTINDQAAMGKEIPNTATVYYNDNIAGDGSATSGPAYVSTGGKVFKKVAETTDGTPLAGAQFKIATNSAGTQYVKDAQGNDIILTSAVDGRFWIKGLQYDLTTGTTYYLVEIVAPTDGTTPYNLLQSPVPFTVTATSFYTNPTTITTPTTPPNAIPDQIINKQGFQIPQTGGIGTLAFTITGLTLMGGAGLLLKRKRNSVS